MNSPMTISLAAMEQISKPAKPNENIYNSKPSIEESFATAESMNTAPSMIRARPFKILLLIIHTIDCSDLVKVDRYDLTLDVLNLDL